MNTTADSISRANDQVDKTKQIMQQNVKKVLNNQNDLSAALTGTSDLKFQASDNFKDAKKINKDAKAKNGLGTKCKLIILVFILISIIAVLLWFLI